MKLTKILEEVITEIGDLSAGTFPFKSKASTINGSIKMKQAKLLAHAEELRNAGEEDKGISIRSKIAYNVTGDSGLQYAIDVMFDLEYKGLNKEKQPSFSTWARVDFDIKGNKGEAQDTNAKEQYKLISTVVAVFLDFATTVEPIAPLSKATIYAKDDNVEDHSIESKRGRIYKHYIEKNLKNLPGQWTVTVQPNNEAYLLTRSK